MSFCYEYNVVKQNLWNSVHIQKMEGPQYAVLWKMIHLKSWINFSHGVYLHRLWDVILTFSGSVWKTVKVSYVSLMRQSKNIRSSKERNSHHTETWLYYRILEYYDGMYHYRLLALQHQSNLLGLQLNELKFNFIKDKHFSLCQIRTV